MFHLAMFWEKIDAAGVPANIAAAPDPIMTINADRMTIPELNQVLFMAAGVASGGDGYGRLEAPSLLRRTRHYVTPVNGNADADAEFEIVPAFQDMRLNPLPLVPTETLEFEVESDTTTTEAQWLMLALSDGVIEPVPDGPTFTIRGQADTALTTDVWSNQALNLDENLPAGRYAVIGMRGVGADLVAARLVFRGGGWRPGCPCVVLDDNLGVEMFRNGGMGSYGEFEHNEVPTVDQLAHSATSDSDIYLDLVQVREGPSS